MRARAVVRKGEKSLRGDPGSELRLESEKDKEKCEDNRRDVQK